MACFIIVLMESCTHAQTTTDIQQQVIIFTDSDGSGVTPAIEVHGKREESDQLTYTAVEV